MCILLLLLHTTMTSLLLLLLLKFTSLAYCSNLSAFSLVRNVPMVIGTFLTAKLNIPILYKSIKVVASFWVAHVEDVVQC